MHIVLVQLHVKPELVDAFKVMTLENARESLQEPDVVRFDVLQSEEDPTRFVFFEVYRTAQGHAKHRTTEHFKRWQAEAPEMLVEPRSATMYVNVFPSDDAWK